MTSYERRLRLHDRAWDLLARRCWALDAGLPRDRSAVHLAHNWIGCNPSHPGHAEHERAVARHLQRLESISRADRRSR